jgi:hypothetical protein
MRIRIRFGRKPREEHWASSVAVQKPDWSHPVKVSPSEFLSFERSDEGFMGGMGGKSDGDAGGTRPYHKSLAKSHVHLLQNAKTNGIELQMINGPMVVGKDA